MEVTLVSIAFLLLTIDFTICREAVQCPLHYTAIMKKCYHFSREMATWQDAHFKCLNLNGNLAIVSNAKQELSIRHYLNAHENGLGNHERWIGGKFNDKSGQWIWGATGKPLQFQAFSRMNYKDKNIWGWNCIITDPNLQNKWNARSCLDDKHYICQTPSNPYLSQKKNFKRNFDRNQCDDPKISKFKRKMCKKMQASPAYLVRNGSKKDQGELIETGSTYSCPPQMFLLGKKCYYFSTESADWNNAHWACMANNSKLATISTKSQEIRLRRFLNRDYIKRQERWIGAIYNWKQDTWRWAMSGRKVLYANFAQHVQNLNNTQHCATLDPQYNHQWNSRNRMTSLPYICQSQSQIIVSYERALPEKNHPVMSRGRNSVKNKTTISPNKTQKLTIVKL